MLDQITPVLLTYNEEANITQTLQQLTWARDIVIVDSFSDDKTLEFAKQFPQVRIFQRPFDIFYLQRNFSLRETHISTEWVLGLDADFLLPPPLIKEMSQLNPPHEVSGYLVKFIYAVYGQPLRASVYPPLVSLFRKDRSFYYQDGHTERIRVEGKIESLKGFIIHDDRKRLYRWFDAQYSYAPTEVIKLLTTKNTDLTWIDRIRKLDVFAPFAVFIYCLLFQGIIFNGWRGLFYSFQRMSAEIILSIFLLDKDLRERSQRAAPG